MILRNLSLSLSLFVVATILRVQEIESAGESLCDLEFSNADVGVLEPTDEALSRNVCTWTIIAASGRKLLVNIESIRLNVNATLEVVTDGNTTGFSGHCSKCFPSVVGRTVQVTYKDNTDIRNSGVVLPLNSILSAPSTTTHESDAANSTVSAELSVKPYFLINYSSFDPHKCEYPISPINGFIENDALEIGSQILYRCHTPYLLEKGSVLKATCVLNSALLVPSWSNQPPRCVLPECGKTSIRITLDEYHTTTVVHSGNILLGKTKNCMWEIATSRKKHLIVSVEYLNLPNWSTAGQQQRGAVLELYDGKVSDQRLLTQLSGKLASSANEHNFTTIFNKLIITLRVSSFGQFAIASNDPMDEMESKINDYGFHLSVSSKVPLCEIPSPPPSGDVKGWVRPIDIATKTEPKWMGVYSCNAGYYLNGSGLSTCLENGKWNNDPPVCLPIALTPEITTLADDGNLSANVEETFMHEKSSPSRQFKNRRPHPQSTDDKTNFKPANEDLNFFKQQRLPVTPLLQTTLPNSTGAFLQEDAEEETIEAAAAAAAASGDIPHYPSEGDEFEDSFASYPSGNEDYLTDKDGTVYNESDTGSQDFPMIPVILGVGIPLILGLVALGGYLVYRKLYPVRMGIGRKFDTFENPVYEQNKRGPTTPGGTLLPGVSLAQSPAELQRLTMHTP